MKKFNKNGSWTKKYEEYRRKNNLCNSPRAFCLMKKEESKCKT
jgi:hypothetical protein